MKKHLYIIFYLIVYFITACEQHPNSERILEKTTLSIPKAYKLLSFSSDWGIGETTEDYLIVISKDDYKSIKREIEGKFFFKHLDSNSSPLYVLDLNTDIEKLNEIAYCIGNKYYYQIFRPSLGVVITIVLEKDSLMNINYTDL